MDPFSDEPLYYNSENFDKLLVRYAPIQEVDDILSDLYEQKRKLMRKRYYVIGLRGMGKTTMHSHPKISLHTPGERTGYVNHWRRSKNGSVPPTAKRDSYAVRRS